MLQTDIPFSLQLSGNESLTLTFALISLFPDCNSRAFLFLCKNVPAEYANSIRDRRCSQKKTPAECIWAVNYFPWKRQLLYCKLQVLWRTSISALQFVNVTYSTRQELGKILLVSRISFAQCIADAEKLAEIAVDQLNNCTSNSSFSVKHFACRLCIHSADLLWFLPVLGGAWLNVYSMCDLKVGPYSFLSTLSILTWKQTLHTALSVMTPWKSPLPHALQ